MDDSEHVRAHAVNADADGSSHGLVLARAVAAGHANATFHIEASIIDNIKVHVPGSCTVAAYPLICSSVVWKAERVKSP